MKENLLDTTYNVNRLPLENLSQLCEQITLTAYLLRAPSHPALKKLEEEKEKVIHLCKTQFLEVLPCSKCILEQEYKEMHEKITGSICSRLITATEYGFDLEMQTEKQRELF